MPTLSGNDNTDVMEHLRKQAGRINGNGDIHLPIDGETTGDVLMRKMRDAVPVLWDPFLPQRGISCVAGSSDTGKSMFARNLAIGVACGHGTFLGNKLNVVHKSAIYLATEDNDDNTGYLLRKQAHDHQADDLKSLRFIFDPDEPFKTLSRSLKKRPADLVIVDTFGDVFNGQLNDSQHVRGLLNPYQQLANEAGCQIVFLHHTGKRTEDFAPNKSNLLGSQGFEAKMRVVLELRRDHSNPNHRHLCVVKGNYLPSSAKRESYVLNFDEQFFTFSNTNERVPFEMLSKQQDDPLKAKWNECKALMDEGVKGDELAKRLRYSNRGGVSKLIKKAKENGWTDETTDDNVS